LELPGDVAVRNPLRFRLSTLLLAMIPLGLLFLYLRHRWESRPVDWRPWSQQALNDELESGRVGVVHFTARWSQTTVYNFHMLNSSEKLAHFTRRHNVAMFVADWTEESDEIERALEELKLRSISATVIYGPRVGKPVVLRDIATDEELLSALQEVLQTTRQSPSDH